MAAGRFEAVFELGEAEFVVLAGAEEVDCADDVAGQTEHRRAATQAAPKLTIADFAERFFVCNGVCNSICNGFPGKGILRNSTHLR